MTRLPDTLLNRLWQSWCIHTNMQYCQKDYASVSRRSGTAQAFENWIFTQGGVVQRANKKCYIEFSDEQDAIIFRLKHA